VGIINFWYDMSIGSRIGNLGTYAYDTWYKVRMTYDRLNASTVRVAYWIDDVPKGIQDVPAASYEDNLLYFHGSSGDGTVWLDEIKVTACTDTEVGFCNNGVDDDCDGPIDYEDQPDCTWDLSAAQSSTVDPGSLTNSKAFNRLAFLLIPVGALVVLRIWHRKR
jgi:hypothetical protein